MGDLQTLIDMGFEKRLAEKALEVTNNKGVEQAMEWLLAHADENIPLDDKAAVPADPNLTLKLTDENAASGSATTTDAPVEVKSFKCDECGKLFKNHIEVEYHGAKSGHSQFSESTEEKKQLSEEEKREQLVKLEEKLKQKRLEREDREKLEELDREKNRIRSGKDMSEAKRRMEEMEMKKIVQQRKRDKQEEKIIRERIRAQIADDKETRKARMAAETGQVFEPVVVKPETPHKPVAQQNYTHTRIQVRLHDGSTLTETFDVKEQLSAVRLFIQMKSGNDNPFGLMTSFPRQVFQNDDYDKPLEVLGLTPSAVLIVTKVV